MDILFHITTPDARPLVAGLASACNRAGRTWACFFTNDGVSLLTDESFVSGLNSAGRSVVCEHSWQQHMGTIGCPVELGSQTTNSALMAEAGRVVSL